MTHDGSTAPAAIVTGAGSGIGWAAAQALADAGYRVAVADLHEADAAERAATLGPQHLGVACDVTDEAAVRAAVTTVRETFGRIDVLVNNAGIGDQTGPTVEQQFDAFQRVLAVHLHGTFLMSREVAPHLLAAGRGAIVNLASIAASAGLPTRNAYGAAKAGIVAMTRSMASEWAGRGVRVNAVAPGYVRTALVDRLAARGALDTALIDARTPMGRMAAPAEVAAAIVFLASPQASYITGAVLPVDGGWTAYGATVPPVPPVVNHGA